jgi:hypothetical protein
MQFVDFIHGSNMQFQEPSHDDDLPDTGSDAISTCLPVKKVQDINIRSSFKLFQSGKTRGRFYFWLGSQP